MPVNHGIKNPRAQDFPGPGMPFSILRTKKGPSLYHGDKPTFSLREGLPASGSSYLPRLPIPLERNSDTGAAFIPGYGGGSATESHRLPCYGLYGLSGDLYV